jgi:curved DNA-binding protein CbpA
LGARLTADFTAEELRRAYRKLALEYHPDRHPGSTEPQEARLTRILADLNEHHRHLLAALKSAA